MLADDPVALLVFCYRCILEVKQAEWLEQIAESRRLDSRQLDVNIVQKAEAIANPGTWLFKPVNNHGEVLQLDKVSSGDNRRLLCKRSNFLVAKHAIGDSQAGNGRPQSDRIEALTDEFV